MNHHLIANEHDTEVHVQELVKPDEKLENNISISHIMPKKNWTRMRGRGQDLLRKSAIQSKHLNTARKNLRLNSRLLSAKPPLQQPGQLAAPRQYGGALRDKFGAYLYVPHS